MRIIFQNIDDVTLLHKVLLHCDKNHPDETFTKTALEWAVENNDRLCTTEILHQEFECHRASKFAGLSCLRRQLTGDELLMWTIETFTMFYDVPCWLLYSFSPVSFTDRLLSSTKLGCFNFSVGADK